MTEHFAQDMVGALKCVFGFHHKVWGGRPGSTLQIETCVRCGRRFKQYDGGAL